MSLLRTVRGLSRTSRPTIRGQWLDLKHDRLDLLACHVIQLEYQVVDTGVHDLTVSAHSLAVRSSTGKRMGSASIYHFEILWNPPMYCGL